jgi:hypothetical protein
MVLKENRRPSTGELLSRGISSVGESLAGSYGKYRENQKLKEQYGVDLHEINDPQTRAQIMAEELRFGRTKKQAEATHGVKYNKDDEDLNIPKRSELPEFGNKSSRRNVPQKTISEPTRPEQQVNVPKVPGKGNLPQTSHGREVYQAPTPDEIENDGQRIAEERTARGMPTSKEEGIQIALQNANNKLTYSANVNKETDARVASQRDYGNIAETKFNKIWPNATDDILSLTKQKAEQAAAKYDSESEIEKETSQFITDMKDTKAIVEKLPNYPRSVEKAYRAAMGQVRNKEKIKEDHRAAVQPFLKLGLIETARQLLKNKKFGVEETEDIINPLSATSNNVISKLPEFTLPKTNIHFLQSPGEVKHEFTPEEKQLVRDTVKEAFDSDSSVSPVGLRAALAKKNVDWETYRDVISDLVKNGEIKVSRDQSKMIDSYLKEPPLDRLDQLLYELDFKGK